MLVVRRDDVGAAALARMRRAGVVRALTDDAGAAPSPVPWTVARAIALAAWIPRKAAATGLAALWVHGLTRDALAPAHVEVVVPRGAHPDPPSGVASSRWSFTTHQTVYSRAVLVAGVRIARPADAVASALRTARLADAIPAAYRTVASGLATTQQLYTAVSGPQSADARSRAQHALRAVQEALEASRTNGGGVRR
ncbi:hypothetical protein [Demequina sp.]|uniref:hypothetical protein n=1 Tax=Demequina sp. TaxID=2050685 RepID=UPI0025BFD297|nr:hypothetical protein [Demequina sp.]